MNLNMFLKRGRHLQYVSAVLVNILSFAAGAAMAWTSPVLPKLANMSYNPFPRDVTSEEAMWMGALVSLGTAIGPFPCAFLADRLGRKRTLLWSAVPCFLGWLLTASANSIVQLMIARLVLGLACSVVFTIVPTYVSEIADDDIRGALGSFLQVCITAGMLFVYCIGPYTSYVCFTSICAAIPIVFAATFLWMPESPYFLVAIGKMEEARSSLSTLRSKTQSEIDDEASHIKAAVEEELSNKGTYRELLTSRAQRWPLFIGVSLAAFFQLSGVTAVVIYAETLFQKTTSDLTPDVMAIIMGLMQVCSCLVTPFLFDRLGRKILLLFSSAGMTISLGCFGGYFYVTENSIVDENILKWLPITCIVIFIVTNSVGFGGAIWVVMSEIFPQNLRSHAMAVCTSACFVVAFFIALTFDGLGVLIKSSGTFWLYTAFSALSGVFVALAVPETKGLSFQEIQTKLKRAPVRHVEGRVNDAMVESEDKVVHM